VPVALVVQLPEPSQICPFATVPLHVLAPHDAPAGAYAFPAHVAGSVPSHWGVAHAVAPIGHGARIPCGFPVTGTQVPGLACVSHAWHSPVHAESQQRPSTQNPLEHSSPFVHAVPPPVFFVHVVPLQ
jgi:hypothetical protein